MAGAEPGGEPTSSADQQDHLPPPRVFLEDPLHLRHTEHTTVTMTTTFTTHGNHHDNQLKISSR